MKASLSGLTLLLLLSTCATAQTAHSATPPVRVSLREAHLPAAMRDEITSTIVQKIRVEDSNPKLEVNVLDFFTEFPNLAQDGRRTISVQSVSPYAGANGIGELWLFQVSGSHALLLLNEDASGYGPHGLVYHNGLRDYQVTLGWGDQWGTSVYRFDGTRYRPAFCENLVPDGSNNLKPAHRGKCNSR